MNNKIVYFDKEVFHLVDNIMIMIMWDYSSILDKKHFSRSYINILFVTNQGDFLI